MQSKTLQNQFMNVIRIHFELQPLPNGLVDDTTIKKSNETDNVSHINVIIAFMKFCSGKKTTCRLDKCNSVSELANYKQNQFQC